jgi:hypothetical protein
VKQNHLLAFCIAITAIGLKAQVPYRKGQLWGISDTNKNMILPAKYSKIEFFNTSQSYTPYGHQMPEDYLTTIYLTVHDSNKMGLFGNGKFVIPIRRYNPISLEAPNLFAARVGPYSEYYNFKGISLLGDSLLKTIPYECRMPKIPLNIGKQLELMVFASHNQYYLKVYDIQKQQFKDLITSKGSITLLNYERLRPKSTDTKAPSKNPSQEIDDQLRNIKRRSTQNKTPSKNTIQIIEIEDESYETVLVCKVGKYDNDYYIVQVNKKNQVTLTKATTLEKKAILESVGDGSGSGYPGRNYAGDGPSDMFRSNQIEHEYIIDNQELWELQYQTNYRQKKTDTISYKKVECEDCHQFQMVEYDKVINLKESGQYKKYVLHNYVFYRQNDKWGLIEKEKNHPANLDTIIPKHGYLYNLTYISGVRNNQGEMKYGALNIRTAQWLPPVYDSIPPKDHRITLAFKNNSAYIYNSKMDIIYGPADSMALINQSTRTYDGNYYAYKGTKKQLIKTNGEYMIYKQSPWLDRQYTIKEPIELPNVFLFNIYNSKDQFLGYASSNGKLFFED